MRKLIVFNNVSLDGYFVDANGNMSWAHEGMEDAGICHGVRAEQRSQCRWRDAIRQNYLRTHGKLLADSARD